MYVRYDASSIVLLQDGITYLLGISALTESGDASPSVILIYNSENLIDWNYISTISPPAPTTSVKIPSLYIKTNGDVLVVAPNSLSSTTNRIIGYTSSDNGTTWSSYFVIRENVSEYMAPASNRLHLSDSGRLVFPFNINTNGILNSQTGNYTGKVMYSDDEGENWSTSVSSIVSVDNLCVENGIFKKETGTIVNYFRTRSNSVYASNSTDDGETWGAVYNLGIGAIDSQSTVLRLSSGNFVAAFNPVPSRSVMQVVKSTNGTSWSDYFLLNSEAPYHFIEPSIVEKNDKLYVFYSKSNSTQSQWSLAVKDIRIDY